jgi:hypothetical protein
VDQTFDSGRDEGTAMTPASDEHSAPGTDAVGIAEAAVGQGADAAGTASLEKVRDILFGSQMRDVDRRFARLEERIARETRDLKEEIRRRLDALEAYARQESEALADQVRHEQGERTEADARLARELADAARTVERRTAALEEQVSKGQREVRQQMLEQHQRLSDDTRQKIEEVLAALAREAHELRNDKTDRLALASLLKEMAMRLTGEFRLAADETGNG